MTISTLVLSFLLLIIPFSTSVPVPVPEGESLEYIGPKFSAGFPYMTIRVDVEAADSSPENLSSKNIDMIVSLYSSELVIAAICFKDKKDLESHFSEPKTKSDDGKVRKLDFGSFSAEGYDVKANSYLSKTKYWKYDKAVVLPKISPPFDSIYGIGGVIGLGYEGVVKDQSTNDRKAFAVNFRKKTLVFNPNIDKEIRGEPRHHLKTTNANWQILGSGSISVNEEVIGTGDMALLFDMNVKRTILPRTYYDALSKKLVGPDIIGLDSAEFRSNHYSAKDILKFPNISISIGDQKLVLEPKDYLLVLLEEVLRYNFAVSRNGDIDETNDLIYPVEEKYKKNVIVLGREFLEKTYTVFDANDGQITMYNPDEQKEVDERLEYNRYIEGRQVRRNKKAEKEKEAKQKEENDAAEKVRLAEERKSAQLKWIALVVVILVLAAAVTLFLWKKKQANRLSVALDDQYRTAA